MPTTDPTGPAALAFDRLLTEAPPDVLAAIAVLGADLLPPGLADQVEAATAEQAESMTLAAGALDGERVAVDPRSVPAWARLGLADAFARWALCTGETCLHAPTPVRPGPVVAAAWRPGLVVCRQCTHLLALRPRSDADMRCDGCGRVTGGVEVGDGLRQVALQAGPLLYMAGACGECMWTVS
ncbi:hypothetical protein SAMN05216207_104635 [Pseudonocardia ammonioxydans]|uniref:Uncharacterized protein n=1 Tax=Pseudonocardia ammonioxydans TaxID=260086 RepID=A0A1I5GGA0_PSUAM|nr:hypothetical protein [Pseudonocardia ammonioxydans]SFO34899.1 hypothetical protein SAMN05216207_104635 [Pseudonocardia ammonioxydans]